MPTIASRVAAGEAGRTATVPRVSPVLILEQDADLPGHGLLGLRIDAGGLTRHSVGVWKDDLTAIDPRSYSAIVALGGKASAYDDDGHPWLSDAQDLLRRATHGGTPVLGICLGGQVLARALGAEVRPAELGEYGWGEISPLPAAAADPVFSALTTRSGTYQWHGDVFDVPPGATRLAESDVTANQAFRFGENSWGIQFHPEVEPDVFDTWNANHPGASDASGLSLAELRAIVVRECDASRAWRTDLFDRFLAVATNRER